jgi:cytochrome c
MKIYQCTQILALILYASCCRAQENKLTAKEEAEGWKLLFDGKTTAGWRNFKSNKIGPAWKVTEGALTVDPSDKNVKGGDIISDGQYGNFELLIEWKLQACGNSGIFFNVKEDPKYDYVFRTGPEMQILDNTCNEDAIDRHRAGNLYDLIESKTVTVKPAGEWNSVKIISNHGHLELWQNGDKQVETEMHTPAWDALVQKSKFKDMPDFGKASAGHLALQDHGFKVSFRNIKIRELK